MSARALGWTFDNSPYSGHAFVVHLAIADVVNDVHDNQFWMKVADVATKARCSAATVTRTLAQMVDDGYLVRLEGKRGKGRASLYQFVMPETGQPPRAKVDQIDRSTSPANGVSQSQVIDLPGVSQSPHDRSIEPSNTNQETPRARARARNLVFDALVVGCGYDYEQMTKPERTRAGIAVKQIKEAMPEMSAEVLAEEVTARCAAYRARFRVPITPLAVAGNWSSLRGRPLVEVLAEDAPYNGWIPDHIRFGLDVMGPAPESTE